MVVHFPYLCLYICSVLQLCGSVLEYFTLFTLETTQTEHVEENEEPFIAPLGLNVPSDVELVCMCNFIVILGCSWDFRYMVFC